jgi:carboxypeptidase T
LLLTGNTWAQNASIVRFKLTPELKQYLRAQAYDVTGINYKTGEIEALLSDDELKELLAFQNVQVVYAYPEMLSAAPDEDYKNPEEVSAFLKEMHFRFPHLTQLKVIGYSLEGREILAIKISDNAEMDELEPVMLVNGMHHAREVMTPEVTTDMVEYLLQNYGQVDKVTQWVNETEIWIVPMLNVDGNNKMWNGNSMWRKNTRNGHGVDINRNYPHGWNSCNGSSSSRYAQDYRGTEPASEPETQAMMNFVASIKPVFNISYHSYSELVIYPFGCRPKKTPTGEAVEEIGKQIASKLDYRPGTAWELLYNADGGDIDWMYAEHQVIPYVIEVNSTNEGFHPRYHQWRDKTVERNRAGWMHLLDRLQGSSLQGKVQVGEYSEIIITKASDNKTLQRYKINPDGSFYIILKPGRYNFSFQGIGTRVLNNLEIKDKTEISL